MTAVTTIRASMLPSYPDCPRRAAAKQWRREIEAAGYELRETMPSVGAAVGTAVHAAAAHCLQAKIDGAGAVSSTDGIEIAVASFREEVERGAEWDNTTPNRNVAETQIARMTRAYLTGVAPHITPRAVELRLMGRLGDGWRLSGHLDLLTTDGTIRDLKTGALLRPYQAQLGGYSLLATAQMPAIDVAGVAVDFIRRTPRKTPQDGPVSENYDNAIARRAAWSIIKQIQQDVGEFRARMNGGDDPPEEAFLANPMSMMCRPQFCPAHGTEFCNMGRKD